MRKPYSTDLTDEQWHIMQPLIPAAKPGGRPRTVDMREILNTLFYQNRTGCQWDLLPHDLFPKSTVYDYFCRWRDDGTWQKVLDALREAVREQAGRHPAPSAGSIDSQTVQGTEVGQLAVPAAGGIQDRGGGATGRGKGVRPVTSALGGRAHLRLAGTISEE